MNPLVVLLLAVGADAGIASPAPSPTTLDRAEWPRPSAALTLPAVAFPRAFKRRIYLDAGHGAEGNEGAESVNCEKEERFALRVANDLHRRLTQTQRFEVRVSRADGARVPYARRVAEAEAWGADALISIHFDARGVAYPWSPWPGRWCYRGEGSPGFAVLWSEDGPDRLTRLRSTLAGAVAARMREAGFLAYGGEDYQGHYVPSPSPGVFINRLGVGRRIFLLRKPRVPSVIIETHHGLDLEEAARWRENRTLEAFAAAISAALVDALR